MNRALTAFAASEALRLSAFLNWNSLSNKACSSVFAIVL